MNELLGKSKVVVCVGSGGVGKTTVAASLGLLGATLGRKVLVLTVDPARRLKTTLGIQEGDQIVQVPIKDVSGELWAMMIDPKKVFDQFVKRAADTDERASRILKNKLYVQLSTTLSGSQEFTALEALYSAYQSAKYDLIILDTPPAQHAIDFLKAPQKLATLFDERITKWFRDPEGQKQGLLVRIVQTGTKQVLKLLESLTGSEFMKELADFFQNIEKWQHKLEDRTTGVHRVLVGQDTHFLLVTSFDEAKLKEAEEFSKEIRKAGYQLSSVVINRSYPVGFSMNAQVQGETGLEKKLQQYQDYYKKRDQIYHRFQIKMTNEGQVVRLPEMESDISDLDGVKELALKLKKAEGDKI